MSRSTTAVVTNAPVSTARGADLLGWSALPLLADPVPGAPWLFVTGTSNGWLSPGPLPDARFVAMSAQYDRDWPFDDGSLGGVVIDGDAFFVRGGGRHAIDRAIAEAYRTVARRDNVLIACGQPRVPRRLLTWKGFGGQSAAAWRAGMARRGLTPRSVAFMDLEAGRLTNLALVPEDPSQQSEVSRAADRVLFRVAPEKGAPIDAVRSMVEEASHHVSTHLYLDRIAIRKIGKTAVFLQSRDGRRYILRIARSPVARSRAVRNFDGLSSIRASSLPAALKNRVPEALIRGVCGSYEYFLETSLDGRPGPSSRARRHHGWTTEAVDYIAAVHAATAHHPGTTSDTLARLVLEPIERLTRAFGSPAGQRVLAQIRRTCDDALDAGRLPIVHTHGDFTESNCLFDDDGRLSGVVDWEVSEPSGLPLLDLLQLMPVAGENGRHPRWQRFGAWMELCRAPHRVAADPVMGPYVRTLGVDTRAIPALVLLQWVTHVADRIEARCDDERWMRLRVWQPLETLQRTLGD